MRPEDCPCQSDVDEPGPHIDACPWSDPDYDPYGPPPADLARATMLAMWSALCGPEEA